MMEAFDIRLQPPFEPNVAHSRRPTVGFQPGPRLNYQST